MRLAALLALLIGCSSAEDRYNIVVVTELCEARAACSTRIEVTPCVDAERGADRSACTIDASAVRECRRALIDAECVPVPFMDYDVLDEPEVCAQVWSC